MDDLEKQVADLTEAFAAQDMVLREMLSMFTELGRFSKAWDNLESDAALAEFILRLRAQAGKREKRTARALVLLEFAKHAEKFLTSNHAPLRHHDSDGEPQ